MLEYKKKLAELAKGNENYVVSTKKLVNSGKEMIGVRMPDLKKLAKEQVRGKTTEDLREFVATIDEDVYEELMLVGLMIDNAKISDAEKIALMREHLVKVDSWALVDSVAMGKKKLDRELWWDFIDECLACNVEFVIRYGLVLLRSNFLKETPKVIGRLKKVKHSAYYVRMALAWIYSETVLQDYELTMREMSNEKIDAWVRKRALTKMLESYRISDEHKTEIRNMRDNMPR